MQLTLYNWNLTNKSQKSILRQGVVTAHNEKAAREYLVASMNYDESELFFYKKTILSLTAILSYKEDK